MSKPNRGLFKKINLITIIAVYFLILVGGIVRSTGSGMGCPDWPKCFGSYIPPTDIGDLPADYKGIYLQKRLEKNARVSRMIEGIGWGQLAERIRNDKNIFVEQDFNMTKTWIEYINRLVGVIIGLLIILSLISSFTFWGTDNRVVWLSLAGLVLVIFQGWTGSIVVSTNLLPGMITFHMILAIALIALLILVRVRSDYSGNKNSLLVLGRMRWLFAANIVLFLIQIVLGTQIREAIDVIAIELGEQLRGLWINELGIQFYIHRSYSLLLLGLNIYLSYVLFKRYSELNEVRWLVIMFLSLIGLEILTGTVMAYFGIPAYLQPIHLLLAIGVFGLQYYLYLLKREDKAEYSAMTNG